MGWRRTIARISGTLLTALALAGAAGAEPVQIRAAFGETGQGWLFGSPRDGRCWLALPLHVVAAGGAQPSGFAFDDIQGRSAQSAPPIAVASVPGAVEAAAGATDLAFAPVTSGGRRQGDCNSRLGLSPGLYALVLPRIASLQLRAVQGATTASFPVEMARSLNGGDQGALLLLRPRDERDLRYLKGGLSGGVAVFDYEGQVLPGAMILQVAPDSDTLRALRFDRIAAAFALVEAAAKGGAPAKPAAAGAVAHRIESVLGRLEADAPPLAQLTAPQGGCWRIGLAPGARRVEIVLSIPEGQRVEALRASVPPDCGGTSAAQLDMRRQGRGWSTLSTSCPVSADGTAACRVGRNGPLELRLSLPASGTEAAIGALALE